MRWVNAVSATIPESILCEQGVIAAYMCPHCRETHAVGNTNATLANALVRAAACCCCRWVGCSAIVPLRTPVYNSSNGDLREHYCSQHEREHQAIQSAVVAKHAREIAMEKARAARLLPAELECERDRELLRARMSDVSESRWCAGWLLDLEFILWDMVWSGGGDGDVSQEDIDELRRLMWSASGWHIFERFVPIGEWIGMVAERAKDQSAERQRKAVK